MPLRLCDNKRLGAATILGTANTAARMEARGQAGKIQVAPACYALLKNDFSFEKIPDVDIKGKGMIDLYLWENS
ncbi:MAG: adenylate/guanylate cyclase domain-containing protein [Bacteroidota bacterium]